MRSRYVFTAVLFLVFYMNAYAVQVSVPNLSAVPGSMITVGVSVDDATGIAGCDIRLEYDSAILEAEEARATDLAAGLSLIPNIGGEGIVTLSMAGVKGLAGGSGAILEVIFEVKAGASGVSSLILSDVALYDELGMDISVAVVDGSITMRGVEPPPIRPRVLSISDAAGRAGEVIAATIHIDDITGVAGADIALLYDSAILSVAEVRATNLLAGMTVMPNTDVADRITISVAGTMGAEAGAGPIFNISFKAKEDVSGEAVLTFESAELYDENADTIPVETVDGRITVKGAEVTAMGELTKLEVTIFMYGTHGLLSDGDLSYALKSSTVELNQFVGQEVTVHGTLVHSGIDGGPPLINAFDAQVGRPAEPPVVREHTPGSSVLVMQATYDEANAHGHTYIDIWAGSMIIEPGMFLEFQVAMFSGNPAFRGTVDLHTTDGSTLRDSGAKDQNDISAHPSADLSQYAKDQWYHRKIPLDTLAGKMLDGVMIATDSDEHKAGVFRVYVDNIQITDGEHILMSIYMDEDTIPITGTDTATRTDLAGTEGTSEYSVAVLGAAPVTPAGKLISPWGSIKSKR